MSRDDAHLLDLRSVVFISTKVEISCFFLVVVLSVRRSREASRRIFFLLLLFSWNPTRRVLGGRKVLRIFPSSLLSNYRILSAEYQRMVRSSMVLSRRDLSTAGVGRGWKRKQVSCIYLYSYLPHISRRNFLSNSIYKF